MRQYNRLPSNRIPVEPNRRLVEEYAASEVHEFYDVELGERRLLLPAGSPSIDMHGRLLEARMPVFSALIEENGDCVLQVPQGTSRVSQLLKFIPRDIVAYGEIFGQIGSLNRRLEQKGFGALLPNARRGILDMVAFSHDGGDVYGGSVYLTPPYSFDARGIAEGQDALIAAELEQSGYFAHEHIASVLGRVSLGRHDG